MEEELDAALQEIMEQEPGYGFQKIFEKLQASGGPAATLHQVKRRVRKLREAKTGAPTAGEPPQVLVAAAPTEPPQVLVAAMRMFRTAVKGAEFGTWPWEGKKKHAKTLSEYIQTHPGSSTARKLLASLVLHADCLIKLEGGHLDSALELAGWAHMCDEKGLDWRMSDLDQITKHALKMRERSILSNFVLMNSPSVSEGERFAAANAAVKTAEAQPHLLPRLLQIRSALYSFTQQFDLAIKDLQRALDMVQSHGFSLVPPLADGLPELPDSEASLLQDLGSTLQCGGYDQQSGICLKKYVQMIGEEQPDHYCLPKACYELALSNIDSGGLAASGELSFWIQKAKHFEEKRLFVFPAYESQKKMLANMFAACGKGNGKKHGKGYEKGFWQ